MDGLRVPSQPYEPFEFGHCETSAAWLTFNSVALPLFCLYIIDSAHSPSPMPGPLAVSYDREMEPQAFHKLRCAATPRQSIVLRILRKTPFRACWRSMIGQQPAQ